MVLPVELRRTREAEIRALAVQAPDDLAAGTVDLVQRPGVATRDQQVAVVHLADRVDVKVVKRPLRVRRRVLEALGERYMVQAAPVEQDLAGLEVDLLGVADKHLAGALLAHL